MPSGGAFSNATIDAYDDNLIAVFHLDEAAGNNRSNPVNGAALTALAEINGPIPAVAGKLSNAADLERDSSQRLQASTNLGIVGGLTQLSWACWIRPETLNTQTYLAEDSSAGGTADRFSASILASGAVTAGMTESPGGAFLSATSAGGLISAGTTYFVAGKIDTVNDVISLWVDGTEVVAETSVTMAAFDNSTPTLGFKIGSAAGSTQWDGWVDEVMIWNTALSDAAFTALYNGGTGTFWSQDLTAPAAPDKVVRYRLQDADNQFVTMISGRVGTESDLLGAELGRADDADATTPTHILENDGDGTTSWVTIASSADSYLLGSDTATLPANTDRYVGFGDPDQTGSDSDRAYFLRTTDTPNRNNSAWVKAVNGTAEAIPAAPSITAFSVGAGQVVVTVDGDAGVTNEFFHRLTGVAAVTSGGTVAGDGDITATGLTNGAVYEGFAQSYNASGLYGPASRPIYFVPRASINDASGKIARIMVAVRDLFIDSASLLAWIQSIAPAQTTGNHVYLGRRPQTIPDSDSLRTLGPVVFIRLGRHSMINAGAAEAFNYEAEIVAELTWYENPRASNLRVDEMDRIDVLFDEIQAVGIDLDSTVGGQFVGIEKDGLAVMDLHDESIFTTEWRFRVYY